MNDKRAQQDRHGDARRHTERNRRDHAAAQSGVVRRAWAQYAADIAFAKPFFVGRALHRVGVGEPLGSGGAHPRDDRRKGTQGAAADDQPPVAEGVLDALHHPAKIADFLLGDTGAEHRKLDRFRNRVEADGDGNKTDAVP